MFGKSRQNRVEEQKLHDLDSKMAAIGRSQAVIEFDLDGHILDANDNLLKTMGYALDEIRGQHHRTFMDPEEAAGPSYAAFWRDLNEGRFVATKFRRLAKGGREVWLQASYNPVMGADGQTRQAAAGFDQQAADARHLAGDHQRVDRFDGGDEIAQTRAPSGCVGST